MFKSDVYFVKCDYLLDSKVHYRDCLVVHSTVFLLQEAENV